MRSMVHLYSVTLNSQCQHLHCTLHSPLHTHVHICMHLAPLACPAHPHNAKHLLTTSTKAIIATIIAERRERSERSEANNRVLFEIPRYLYIYIYIYIYICMSVCKCIVQDRAHLTQVLSRRPLRIWHTGCCSAHHFEESPLR